MTSSNDQHRFIAIIIAAIGLGVLGRLIELVLPVMLNALGRDLSLSNQSLGVVAAAELIGTILFSLTAAQFIRTINQKILVCAGVAIFALANLLSAYIDSLYGMIIVRFLAGLLGEGPLLVVAVSLLGSAKGASRLYAAFMGIQMLVGAIALYGLSVVDGYAGFSGIMQVSAVLAILGLLAIPFLPSRHIQVAPIETTAAVPRRSSAWEVLIAMGLFHVAVGAAWAFMQQKGTQMGFSTDASGGMLSIMMASGILGALYVGSHDSPRVLVLWSCIAIAAGAIGAMLTSLPVTFVLFGLMVMIGWNIAIPHQIALLGADLKASSSLPYVPGAQGIGLAAGPILAGSLSQPGNYEGVAVAIFVTAAMSMFLFYRGYKAGQPNR